MFYDKKISKDILIKCIELLLWLSNEGTTFYAVKDKDY